MDRQRRFLSFSWQYLSFVIFVINIIVISIYGEVKRICNLGVSQKLVSKRGTNGALLPTIYSLLIDKLLDSKIP